MVWAENTRYPDPSVRAIEPEFQKYMLELAAVERIATGFRWVEGPVWVGDGRYLVFSDIPNDRLMKWDETTGQTSVFRQPSNNANGGTRDLQGRLIHCEQGARRVTRTEHDGSLTVLADSYLGKRLNSPNDVVVKSDGSIWFTDPPFGILGDYEGHRGTAELPTNVYRLEPDAGLQVVADDLRAPNGLAFSPDESKLYVVQSLAVPHANIVSYDVVDSGARIENQSVLVDGAGGTPDGFRVDEDGNLWCGWGMSEELDGVRVFNPEGTLIGQISLPERCANLTFGGPNRNRLFMAASRSVYSLYVNTRGAR
ncbi:MAG: gluconolactonase [Glaciihabitans sp.]|jgi:gluconolactonase|nr:gluconolactonase [Glaciihabitans sp.]